MVRDVEADSTVVGIPGRVVHQSGVKVNPLAHSALPDAEASVIRNLMDRIDRLESELAVTHETLQKLAKKSEIDFPEFKKIVPSQNIKDREIIEYLGEQ